MTPPVNPYRIDWRVSGFAVIWDREAGVMIGYIQRHARAPQYWEAWVSSGPRTCDLLPRLGPCTEAAALVYQTWLDRTSEGMKK